MKALMKKIMLVVCVLFFSITSGCYDSMEVDETAYVVAIGIDNGTSENLRISLLLAVPIAVGVGPESGETDKSTTLVTVEAPTIFGGVNVINSIRGKQVNFSHAKLILLSKELAMDGIQKYVHAFIRFREFRPHMFMGIARGEAREFLLETKPLLEANPAKYYELLMESYQYTGFSINSTLENFYMKMECTCEQPVTALMDINEIKSIDDLQMILPGSESNGTDNMAGHYRSGKVPVISETKLTNMGLAVFREDKMVGELNGREALYYLMVTGKLKRAYFSMPEDRPENTMAEGTHAGKKDYVSMRLSMARNPVFHVNMQDDRPFVTIHVSLEGDILSADSVRDYSTGDGLKKMEGSAAKYIQEGILRFMEKTRDDFNSDICATGKPVKKTFLLWEDWLRFHWVDQYEKAQFQVSVNVAVRRSGITIKQVPMVE